MKDKGIKFGFSTLEVKAKDIRKNLSNLLDYGMSESDVLHALTVHPAELLGLSNVMGTLEAGKMANLVITDKPYLEEKSNVRHVMVGGYLRSFEVKKKKKKSMAEEEIKPEGKWSYTTETLNGTVTGQIVLKESDGDYSGTISNSQTGDSTELTEVLVNGNTLTLSFPFDMGGTNLQIKIDAEIDGETFEGNMSVGSFGSYEIDGQKEPEK